MKPISKYILFTISAIIFGMWFNQLIIQYYVHDYLGIAYFNKVYSPWECYRLARYFQSMQGFEAGDNIVIVTLLSTFLVFMLELAICRKFFGKKLDSDRHGTARFATILEIEQTNLLQSPTAKDPVEKRYGLIVGAVEHTSGIPIVRYDTKKSTKLRWLMHSGHQHVLLIAPTGGGKGVGIVTPNLLNYPDSVVMYDMKGKDWETTAGYRSSKLGNLCVKFEPTNGDGSSCMFNPMEFIIVGTPQEVSESGNLALMLVDADGKGVDGDHFKTNGTKLLAAAILHILYTKKNKNLAAVTAFLSGIDPDTGSAYKGVKDWLGEMSGNNKQAISHLSHYAYIKNITLEQAKLELGDLVDETGYNKFIKQISSALYFNNGEKEVAGIVSSANTPLDLFNDPIIARNTSQSTIKLTDFQSGKQPISLYIVVMPRDQKRIRPLTRILITQLIDTVQATEHGKSRELLFLLDEFATLRKMDVIATALATIRSFKARFILVVQDLSQLDEYYDKLASSIISNCGIRIGYPSNDLKTNEQLAKWTGETTYVAETVSTAISRQQGFAIGGNVTITTSKQESQRTLLTPNEVSTMGKRILVFREGQNAIYGTSYNYREDINMGVKLNLPVKHL
ncbi:MAG: type secretion system protein VirD4 [Pseudomonadota bacterium]|nr:type secretion system protein VirD4 [Pseudomonadota bacterium]